MEDRVIRRYSQAFKRQVVEEIESVTTFDQDWTETRKTFPTEKSSCILLVSFFEFRTSFFIRGFEVSFFDSSALQFTQI